MRAYKHVSYHADDFHSSQIYPACPPLGLVAVKSASMAFKKNSIAARAQIESDDVAAVRVRKTGDSDTKTKNIIKDDFKAFRSGIGEKPRPRNQDR